MNSQEIKKAEAISDSCFSYQWPEGRLLVKIGRSGLGDHIIEELNLKITFLLQPLHTPNMDALHMADPQMMVWTVDITQAKETDSFFKKQLQQSKPQYISCCDYCGFCCSWTICCPCAALVLCCTSNTPDKDTLYWPHFKFKRRKAREEMARHEYIDAHTRLPLIDLRSGDQ